MEVAQEDGTLCVTLPIDDADGADFGMGLGTRVELDDDEGERIGDLIRHALAQDTSNRSNAGGKL